MFPLIVHKVSSFFKSLPALIFVFIFVFDSSHPNGCEYLIMILTCISLIFSDAKDLYINLLAMLFIFFAEMPIQALCPFFHLFVYFVVAVELQGFFIYFGY